MTAQDALETLARASHAQAGRAISDAQSDLCRALDAKMAEIAAFRAQVAQQTKQLHELIVTAHSQQRKLSKPQIGQAAQRALDLQGTVEQINQKVRVLEETQRLIDSYH